MEFNEIEFDNLDDMEADELRELIQKFSEVHDANHEAFKDVNDRLAEFNEEDSKLTEKVAEKTSLSEESADALSYSDKRSLLADFKADDGDEETFDEDEDDEQEFEDRGKQGKTHPEDDEGGTPDHVEKAFKDISGIQLS